MEDIRTYREMEDEQAQAAEDERVEFGAPREDEIPFHVPRD